MLQAQGVDHVAIEMLADKLMSETNMSRDGVRAVRQALSAGRKRSRGQSNSLHAITLGVSNSFAAMRAGALCRAVLSVEDGTNSLRKAVVLN